MRNFEKCTLLRCDEKKCHHVKQSYDLTLHIRSNHIEGCCYAITANQTPWLMRWIGFPEGRDSTSHHYFNENRKFKPVD